MPGTLLRGLLSTGACAHADNMQNCETKWSAPPVAALCAEGAGSDAAASCPVATGNAPAGLAAAGTCAHTDNMGNCETKWSAPPPDMPQPLAPPYADCCRLDKMLQFWLDEGGSVHAERADATVHALVTSGVR